MNTQLTLYDEAELNNAARTEESLEQLETRLQMILDANPFEELDTPLPEPRPITAETLLAEHRWLYARAVEHFTNAPGRQPDLRERHHGSVKALERLVAAQATEPPRRTR
jgi:hypothetical protein